MSFKIWLNLIVCVIYLFVMSGKCLKLSPIGVKCQSSDQCIQLDINSMCFASDNKFNEWQCLCKSDYYYDQNRSQKCLEKISFGNKCDESQQCFGENSVCDDNNRCLCHYNYYFDHILNDCKHNNSLKCSEDQEWNQFTNECQTSVYYSHRGGVHPFPLNDIHN